MAWCSVKHGDSFTFTSTLELQTEMLVLKVDEKCGLKL